MTSGGGENDLRHHPKVHLIVRLKCKRCFLGRELKDPPEEADTNSDLTQWHHSERDFGKVPDQMLKAVRDCAPVRPPTTPPFV